ncbi:hypothetical protein RND81_14G026800 [Saponaria officinalis]|uniref:RING-type domain-containing protein n=1 Tax=Saponaria officinalis TaxID=3572 RepID=A0AAW1GL18_SAPOF
MPRDSPPPSLLTAAVSPTPQNEQPPQQPPQQQPQQQQQQQQQVEQQQQQDEQQQEQQLQQQASAATIEQHDDNRNDVVSPHDSDLSDDDEDPNPPSEFALVDLLAIRKEVQCPICLGIIKKTRTVMECLHRFCRECIDKSMRMGNNECPACRTHCASRRSLRDDPRYDELIAALYPDIKKFEQEELAFYEEDESRNKQIQDSITQVIARQTEALGKKRSGNKETAGPSSASSQRSYRGTQPRRRRRRRRNDLTEYQDSDDNMDANDLSDKHLSPGEHHQETTTKRKRKRRTNVAMSQSPSLENLSGGSLENNVEQCKEERSGSPGLTCSPEMLAWGRGGVRSSTRHGHNNVSTNKSAARQIRLAKLVDFLHNLEENDNESMGLDVPQKDENGQTTGIHNSNFHCEHQATLQPSSFNKDSVSESLQDTFHVLNREHKFSAPISICAPNGDHLVSVCQQKEAM